VSGIVVVLAGHIDNTGLWILASSLSIYFHRGKIDKRLMRAEDAHDGFLCRNKKP